MANYGTYMDLTTFKAMLKIADTIDDALLIGGLEAASREIDGPYGCRRYFYTVTATKTFTASCCNSLLLRGEDLLSIDDLRTDSDQDWDYDDLWTTADYHAKPFNRFPKWEITVKQGGSYSFPRQEEGVQITGTWGYGNGQSAQPWQASGATLTVATTTGTLVTASDGSVFSAGHTILVGSEQVYCTAVAGNNLTVVRAVNGTTAAVHAGAAASIARYPGEINFAMVLLANRLRQRISSPFGLMGSAEMGTATMIMRSDPDIQRLLSSCRRVEVT